MLLRVAALSSILFLVTGLAFADTTHKHRYYHHKTSYKGDYKGEQNFAPPPMVVNTSPHFSFGGGAYLGAELGLRTNYSSSPSVYKGAEGTIVGGLGYLAKNGLFIAEEVYVGDSVQLQGYTNNANGKPGVKTSWNFGLSILPGYLILDNVLAYGRLGVEKIYFTNAGGNANGGQIGAGLQISLTENWDLRTEYTYSFYGSPSNSCASPDDSAVKSDQVKLGFIYKFV